MARTYNCETIAGLIQSAIDNGYQVCQFVPESLGYGGVALIAPPCEEDGYYWPNVIIQEVYINE